MAAVTEPEDVDEDLMCPVCLDLFKEPVLLECEHNFCKSCIDQFWNNKKSPSCPECRAECPAKKYITNKLLSKVIEKAQKLQQGKKAGKPHLEQKYHCVLESKKCLEHKEVLKLFCQEDGIPICFICKLSKQHVGHTILPLKKAVSLFQDKQTADSSLQSKVINLLELQSKQEQSKSCIQEKAKNLEQHITSEFVKLYQFLKDKEDQLIQQLKDEVAGILGKMELNLKKIKEKTKAIYKQGITDETKRLTQIEEEKDDTEPTLVSGDLNLGVYKGPLQYRIWKEMLSILNPGLSHVTLDPNTAHPNLIVSEDLTTVTLGDKRQQLPDNPERFDTYVCVLGTERLTSGKHYWEVGVMNKTRWDVGVTRESSSRKGTFEVSPNTGFWRIVLRDETKYWNGKASGKVMNLSVKPHKIGVYVDYEGGQVSFYNADNMSHLYTFTDTFTERVYPYFSPCFNKDCKNLEPLKLFHLKL